MKPFFIDVVCEGCGYIMVDRHSLAEAKPELVKVGFEFTKEYGIYK